MTTCGHSLAATSILAPMARSTGSADTLDGGPGNDTFHTRADEVDRITCGDGFDTALLDNVDVITDATAANPNGSCERVIRKAPKPHANSKSEGQQQSPKDAQVQS